MEWVETSFVACFSWRTAMYSGKVCTLQEQSEFSQAGALRSSRGEKPA